MIIVLDQQVVFVAESVYEYREIGDAEMVRNMYLTMCLSRSANKHFSWPLPRAATTGSTLQVLPE
jgi:hypothetical protein